MDNTIYYTKPATLATPEKAIEVLTECLKTHRNYDFKDLPAEHLEQVRMAFPGYTIVNINEGTVYAPYYEVRPK